MTGTGLDGTGSGTGIIGFAIALATKLGDQKIPVQKARAFCQVHSVEYWKNSAKLDELNALGPTEKQVRLIEEIRSTITSEEMRRVVYEEAQGLSAEEFYPYLQRELPKLTGKPFDCPEIEAFYIAQ